VRVYSYCDYIQIEHQSKHSASAGARCSSASLHPRQREQKRIDSAVVAPVSDAINVAPNRQENLCSCIPVVDLVQLRRGERAAGELARHIRIYFCVLGTSQPITHKGTCMKSAIVLKVAALAVVAGLVGCTDIKPLQAEVADLKSQVGKLQSDVSAAKQSADQANSAAQAANQAASGAQSTANQALAASQASQSCCDATNEKIDRMFRRSVSK
jgi:hypothetical protein